MVKYVSNNQNLLETILQPFMTNGITNCRRLALNSEQLRLVKRIMADGGYTGENFAELVQSTIGAEMIIAKQSDLKHGQITPQRWVVERSFSWLDKCRRLWRNCERYLQTIRIMVALAFIRLLLKDY
ncbi:transposase [Lactiplantibacillus plantarum]|uniref:transposase n=1 Tax=Lactiplantibacillus plantarum TaxID=1590 RepID=UPI0010401642|nr:transposase [Lactiplantibacillus plantarum]QBK74693.1 hypothetical protein E0484_16890 [Lactiplantibacillus plantarum]